MYACGLPASRQFRSFVDTSGRARIPPQVVEDDQMFSQPHKKPPLSDDMPRPPVSAAEKRRLANLINSALDNGSAAVDVCSAPVSAGVAELATQPVKRSKQMHDGRPKTVDSSNDARGPVASLVVQAAVVPEAPAVPTADASAVCNILNATFSSAELAAYEAQKQVNDLKQEVIQFEQELEAAALEYMEKYARMNATQCAAHCIEHGAGVPIEILRTRYAKHAKKSDKWSDICKELARCWNHALQLYGPAREVWGGFLRLDLAKGTTESRTVYIMCVKREADTVCDCYSTQANRLKLHAGCKHIGTEQVKEVLKYVRQPDEDREVLAFMSLSQANRDAILNIVRQGN